MIEKTTCAANFMTERQILIDQIQNLKKQILEHKTNLVTMVWRIGIKNYLRLQYSTQNLHQCVNHFTHLPMGFSARHQKRKPANLLSKAGGAQKRHVRRTR